MSLYHDASSILSIVTQSGADLKSCVYNASALRSSAAQVYALVAETVKWNLELNEVVERSKLLLCETKLTPPLALFLVHDLLLSRRGIAAPARHPLRLAVERHKARLGAEFTRVRVKNGFATVDVFRAAVEAKATRGGASSRALALAGADADADVNGASKNDGGWVRWIRVNGLRTSLDEQLRSTFQGYTLVPTLAELQPTGDASGGDPAARAVFIDTTIPNLLAVSRHWDLDLTRTHAYRTGALVFQNKASCFPALLLDPATLDGDMIDACAAPGNKTSHLAALASTSTSTSTSTTTTTTQRPMIYAVEKDPTRAGVLQAMLQRAGASHCVTVLAGQDFTRLDPADGRWSAVHGLLLDPSCSGSGIGGRDERVHVVLPDPDHHHHHPPPLRPKHRRRRRQAAAATAPPGMPETEPETREAASAGCSASRLRALSAFQLRLVRHAFRFQAARRIVYSTCSVHAAENEGVVRRALLSPEAQEGGWRILPRREQVAPLRDWARRGEREAMVGGGGGGGGGVREGEGEGEAVAVADADADEWADACLRCEKGGPEATVGFFVAGFVRDGATTTARPPSVRERGDDDGGDDEDDEEWNGFSDGD